MTREIDLLCLANSTKNSHRCIAGLVMDGGQTTDEWVRPVADSKGAEVREQERRYANGSEPRLLDVVRMVLGDHVPGPHQPENWTFKHSVKWSLVGEVEADALADPAGCLNDLWISGHSTKEGSNDQVPGNHLVSHSLALIQVDALDLRVYLHNADWPNRERRVQARFEYGGDFYALSVTDPAITQPYLDGPNGVSPYGPAFLTVSLGEQYVDGNCYKIVAAVVPA